jgi:hypothetical protein
MENCCLEKALAPTSCLFLLSWGQETINDSAKILDFSKLSFLNPQTLLQQGIFYKACKV